MCDVTDKPEHPSRMVAENAVELHKWSAPDCTTINAYPCGDHFHIGHDGATPALKAAGARCKARHPFRRPTQPGRFP